MQPKAEYLELVYSTNTPTVCQLSSLHYALDTRIFYKYALSLVQKYKVVVVGIHPQKETIKGVQIIPFREYRNRSLRIFTSWLLMFFKALRIKADLYHIHDPELMPCAILLRLIGKKVIIDVHENIADDIFDKEWVHNKRATFRIFDYVERIACKNVPVVLAEESYLKRYSEFAPNITVIQNYVEPEFFEQFKSNNRNPLHLFYIGIILESRCFSEIMESMNELHTKNLPVHFHCVGRLYSRIESSIISHRYYPKLKPYLHFYGRMNLEAGYTISKQCGIGLCLIKPMKNSVESKPTKLFEYMACGLPIITSHFPLYRKLVEETETGLTVNPENIKQISDAIQKLIADEELIKKVSQNAIYCAQKKFNWESEKAKLLDLYENYV